MVCLLSATEEQVAAMTHADRVARLDLLMLESHAILDDVIAREVAGAGKELAGICILFSGGDDSTTLADLMRSRADYLVHANTGIGIEATRQYVRAVAIAWGMPLIEKYPPVSYEELVLDQGFPGPAMHWKMYQRLKERCLRQARKQLVRNGHRQRVIFLAGRRRAESARRANVPEQERDGAIVWASPIIHWTKLDLNTYRQTHAVPRNPVSALLHMSGECLCGSFAHPGELDEIEMWFPEAAAYIRGLEAKVAATGKFPAHRCRWGWGADKDRHPEVAADPGIVPSATGPLCDSCAARVEGGEVLEMSGTFLAHPNLPS